MTIDELLGLLDMQEEILQFSHFTNADAWEVGNCIVAEAIKRKLPVAVSIRLNNGLTVFQYASDSVNLQSERWLQRKMNTVRTLERSSHFIQVCFCVKVKRRSQTGILMRKITQPAEEDFRSASKK